MMEKVKGKEGDRGTRRRGKRGGDRGGDRGGGGEIIGETEAGAIGGVGEKEELQEILDETL